MPLAIDFLCTRGPLRLGGLRRKANRMVALFYKARQSPFAILQREDCFPRLLFLPFLLLVEPPC